MSDFPYRINNRIRAVNFFRKFLMYPWAEKSLIFLNKKYPKARKFVPPEYLYSSKSYRIAAHDEVVYRLDLSNVIDHSLYFFNRYFTPLQFFELIRENAIILDIGANIGTVALRAASISKNGLVYAFEPDTDNYDSLQFNIGLNSFRNIIPIKKALGHVPGKSKLFKINRHNTGMNRILSSRENFSDFEWIEVVTLDEEVTRLQLERIDLIKIDVEGYELNVLKGAERILTKFRPLIVIEVIEINLKNNAQTSFEVIQFLKSLGYYFVDLKTGKQLMDEHQLETDILCYCNHNPLT